MSQRDDDEMAFPLSSVMNQPGMTLRDWFAGHAIAGGGLNGTGSPDRMANYAYQLADAMMKEREK